MDDRFLELKNWLTSELGLPVDKILPASSDASFRRYFRVWYHNHCAIAMDAPPTNENCESFICVAETFASIGINTPTVLEKDIARGFLLLTDFGTRQYFIELNEDNVAHLYGDAFDALSRLHVHSGETSFELPLYDEMVLRKEMALFEEWFLSQYLQINLSTEQRSLLQQTITLLAENALIQPQVWVHRDFHSRNLMITDKDNPGVLDFQDALLGPITYDLVSLLKDCYIAWPQPQVEVWVVDYLRRLKLNGMLHDVDENQFLRWFDLMGMQRHIKVAGIFSRLNIRDAKPGYLKDIPRTFNYVLQVSQKYRELNAFYHFLKSDVVPRFELLSKTYNGNDSA